MRSKEFGSDTSFNHGNYCRKKKGKSAFPMGFKLNIAHGCSSSLFEITMRNTFPVVRHFYVVFHFMDDFCFVHLCHPNHWTTTMLRATIVNNGFETQERLLILKNMTGGIKLLYEFDWTQFLLKPGDQRLEMKREKKFIEKKVFNSGMTTTINHGIWMKVCLFVFALMSYVLCYSG